MEKLFRAATPPGCVFEAVAFDRFRAQVLHHIAVEEHLLFPALARRKGGLDWRLWAELSKQHDSLLALLCVVPCQEWLEDLRELLAHHHALEEGAGGLAQALDAQPADVSKGLLAQVAALPPIRLRPLAAGRQTPKELEALRRAVLFRGVSK